VAHSCLAKWLNPPPPSGKRAGRPRILELAEDEIRVFKRALLDHESVPVAARVLLHSPAASPATREVLGRVIARASDEDRRPSWPAVILEIARLPEFVAAWHRGRKHAREFEPKARRNGDIVLADGSVIKWSPGWIFESDDMSLNEPVRFFDAGLGHETAGRQGLFTKDAASSAGLQADLCGRPFDAYRAEDIADHFLNVVTTHGLPMMWRLEMGAWASNFVEGIRLKGREERWGALSNLFYVRHKHESTGKANIERSFHESQKLSAHASTSLGRERGEFETATKLYAKAQAGHPQALAYFWTITQAADAIAEITRDENRRKREYPKLDGIHTTPEALWEARSYRRPLRPEDRWYFLPVKRAARIRKGVIMVKVDHYRMPFRFLTYEVNGFTRFRENHPVLIAFHPGRESEGCHVFNAATGPAAQGLAFGELMGIVPVFRDTPEECLAPDGDFSQASKAKAHMRAEYRTIVPPGTGPGTKQSIARDGLGNALAIQTGGSPAADQVILPPRPARLPESPAWSSRAMPATREGRAAEMARLREALENA
jgi:hypothetical protein